MASPSSPYRLSPSSACSSTLIMTPAPPHHHQRGPAPKGHLQPHISNLPRRRRAHRATTLRISAPPAPSSSSLSPLPKEDNDLNANSTSSSYAPSPIQIPSLFPFSKGGLMPPRNGGLGSQGIWQAYRNSPTTASSSSPHRGRKRALQELGYGSGYFLAFEKLGSGEEGDDDEDMAFGATIRITHEEEVDDEACVIEDKRGDDDNGAELRLVVFGSSSREDGVPNLTPAQLRAAVAFGRRQRENGVNQVLITVAPRHSVDALSVGACCIAIRRKRRRRRRRRAHTPAPRRVARHARRGISDRRPPPRRRARGRVAGAFESGWDRVPRFCDAGRGCASDPCVFLSAYVAAAVAVSVTSI
ncbi:hypothetical protein R3P38DRAFT_2918329, partial [Favolaschia claudopus]